MTGCYDPATRPCSGRETGGIRELRREVVELWPWVPNVQGYICRPIHGGSNPSVHGNGRAWDVLGLNAFTPAGQGDGWAIANWLVSPHGGLRYRVQRVMWDYMIWTCTDGIWHTVLAGTDPHTNHIHVEINNEGARLTVRPPYPTGPEPEEDPMELVRLRGWMDTRLLAPYGVINPKPGGPGLQDLCDKGLIKGGGIDPATGQPRPWNDCVIVLDDPEAWIIATNNAPLTQPMPDGT